MPFLSRWLQRRENAIVAELRAFRTETQTAFRSINKNQEKIMSAIDDLTAKVKAEDTVIDSAVALLGGLKSALDAAGTDPQKLAALSADIDAKTQALASAVAANTPADPNAPSS